MGFVEDSQRNYSPLTLAYLIKRSLSQTFCIMALLEIVICLFLPLSRIIVLFNLTCFTKFNKKVLTIWVFYITRKFMKKSKKFNYSKLWWIIIIWFATCHSTVGKLTEIFNYVQKKIIFVPNIYRIFASNLENYLRQIFILSWKLFPTNISLIFGANQKKMLPQILKSIIFASSPEEALESSKN